MEESVGDQLGSGLAPCFSASFGCIRVCFDCLVPDWTNPDWLTGFPFRKAPDLMSVFSRVAGQWPFARLESVPDEEVHRANDKPAASANTDRGCMNSSVLNQRASLKGWEPKFPFDLAVAYEDSETRNRALQLYDRLAQQLLDDYDFQCSWWKFGHLANPALRLDATEAALEANLIIISLQARPQLAAAHRAWIEDWTGRRPHRKSALVALVTGGDAEGRDVAVMMSSLHGLARRASMDFFPHTLPAVESPAARARALARAQQPPEAPPAVGLTPRFVPVTPLLKEILQHKAPFPRWGINE